MFTEGSSIVRTWAKEDHALGRQYYYRLASESSRASSTEDTESVYSLQDRETDVIQDTTDTDTKSEESEYEVEIEYEVDSNAEDLSYHSGSSTSGSESMMMAAVAVAAAMYDSSLEAFITDGEDSDNSSIDSSYIRSDFTNCLQCKSKNDNPLYRFCEKCFQSCRQCKMRKTYKCFPLCVSCYKDRKQYFPPRPKRFKRKRKDRKPKMELPVKLAALKSCLSGLSQDSGIGSSQECPSLDLDRIVIPEEHMPGTSGTIQQFRSSKETVVNDNLTDKNVVTETNLVTDSLSVTQELTDKNLVAETIVDKVHNRLFEEKNIKLEESEKSRVNTRSRKRQFSESSLSEYEVIKKPKLANTKKVTETVTDLPKTVTNLPKIVTHLPNTVTDLPDNSKDSGISSGSMATSEENSNTGDLCMFCNNAPKDGIFVHTTFGHSCCCYNCAKRTFKTSKRCPICNRSVSKVLRLFTS